MFENSIYSLSTYLVPLLSVVYIQFKESRGYLKNHMIAMAMVGIANLILQRKSFLEKLIILLGHLILLPIVFSFDATQKLVLQSLIVPLVLINTLPVWKYDLTRFQMSVVYIVFYLSVDTKE